MMSGPSSTGNTATAGPKGADAGVPSSCSSRSGCAGWARFTYGSGPKVVGDPRPGGDRVREQLPDRAGPRGAVALVLEVGVDQHVAHPHQAGDGGDGRRVELALLQPAVERPQQIGRLRRAERDELAPDPRAVHQPGRDEVLGVAPAVGAEVGARQLEHARGVAPAVEVGAGLGPPRGDVLGPAQLRLHQVARPHRRQVDQDQRAAQPRHADPGPRQADGQGGDARAEQQRAAEREQRDGPRRVPERQRGGRGVGGRLEEPADRGRVVVGVGRRCRGRTRSRRGPPRRPGCASARPRRPGRPRRAGRSSRGAARSGGCSRPPRPSRRRRRPCRRSTSSRAGARSRPATTSGRPSARSR